MAEGKFVISAQNKIKEGLDGAKKDLLGFEDAAKKVGDTLKNAFAVTAIAAGLKKLGEAAFDCFKEFGEGERRLNTLKIALDNNAISVQKATSLIDKMARQSLASKDDIEGLVAELAALGKSDAEIEKITQAAVNLSNVTGKDLNTSFQAINQASAGVTRSLAVLLPEIKNLSTEQLAAGEATKLINKKFGELSTQLAQNDIPQKLKSIADGWGDLKETLGAQVAPLFNPLLEGINSIITAWNSASRAAEAHRQLLSASGWTQKIALNQEIIDANRPRLDDLQAKQTAYGKSVGWNETMLRQSPQYQAWQAEINELIAENIKAQNAINYYTEQLKKTPVSLLNPIDKVALLRNGGTSGSGNDKPTAQAYIPVSIDDFYLFQESLKNGLGDAIYESLTPAVAEAFASNLVAQSLTEQLSAAYSGVSMEGGILGGAAGQITGATSNIDSFSSEYANAFAGAIDSELASKIAEPIETLNTNLVNLEESFLLNFAPPETAAQQLSKAYAGIDLVGGNMGLSTGQRTSGTMSIDAYSSAYADALAGAIDTEIMPQVVEPIETLNTNLVLLEESFLLNFAPVKTMAEELSAIYAGIDMEGGNAGVSIGGGGAGLSSETGATPFGVVLAELSAGMTDAFTAASGGLDSFSSALLGPMSELMAAIGPFANMIAGMNPVLALLIPVIEGLVSVTAPALNAVLKPLFATLQQMGVAIGQALLPIFDALAPVILMIAQILQTLFIPIMQFLSPIMQAFAIMLQPLGPALGALAKAVTILMSPVEWLADLFSYVGEVLKVFAWNIAHPFQQKAGPGEFTSDAFSGLAARLAAIDAMMVNSQSLQGGITTPAFGAGWDASASTASQSASYRTQQITINIYQQAPVVGSGGMAEFVQMIRGQFAELAYYGA
jgi:predicted  nucleic acid-binding Zn-ribbon protein